MSKEWFVYIIGCGDGTVYTGVTTDLTRRLAEHNEGRIGARYTRSRRPVALQAAWAVKGRGPAQKAEYYIKGLSRPHKELLIAHPDHLSALLPDIELITVQLSPAKET